jgi:non-specific serine/threonine protein kinase
VRLGALTPAEILDRLSDRYGLLTRGDRSAPARQKTLRASMNWSFDLCTLEEQTLWTRLAVFAGGFELDAAEGICADDRPPRPEILDVVASLVDKCVIDREEHGSLVRSGCWRPSGSSARRGLRSPAISKRWRRRHRDWYADVVNRAEADWIGPRQVDWVPRLRREHSNLRAAAGLLRQASR